MASQGRNRVAFNKTATGDLVAASTGLSYEGFGIEFICSAALTIELRDGSAGTTLWGPADFQAGDGMVIRENEYPWLAPTTKGNALRIVITGTGNVGGKLTYVANGA